MADDLAAEIAAHAACTGKCCRFSGVVHCIECEMPWPCLVRRLATREALSRGDLDAAYEMATRMTQERVALLAAGQALADAINGYMFGTFTSLPMMEALVAWRALAPAAGEQPA